MASQPTDVALVVKTSNDEGETVKRNVLRWTLAATAVVCMSIGVSGLATADGGDGNAELYNDKCYARAHVIAHVSGEFALIGAGREDHATLNPGQTADFAVFHGNLARGNNQKFYVTGPSGHEIASLEVFGDGNTRC